MPQGLLTQILAFTHSLAHYLGTWIVLLVQKILPMAKELSTLADPIGYLVILSLFVLLTTLAKKVAIVLVCVGWGLLLVRIALMALGI